MQAVGESGGGRVRDMTFDEIIRCFAESDSVPEEAIRAALAAPAAFVDKAVPVLDKIAASKASDVEDRSLTILVHVLGEIGDGRAFAPLMRVLKLPTEELDRLLGDAITETLGSVLISLVGDRASALEDALTDLDIDDFVRSAIFEAWTAQVLTGKVSRQKAKAFLIDYPVRVGLDSSDFGWSSWVSAVTVLGLAETADFARRHLPDMAALTSFLDVPDVTIEDFERELAATLADPDRWKADPNYQPFTDTIEELSHWHSYSEAFREETARRQARGVEGEWSFGEDEDPVFDAPYIAENPYRDVGRNDPCPCGSGKKFKKCHLNAVSPGS